MVLRKEAVTLTSDAKVKMKGNEIVSVVSDIPFYYGNVGATSLTTAAFKPSAASKFMAHHTDEFLKSSF